MFHGTKFVSLQALYGSTVGCPYGRGCFVRISHYYICSAFLRRKDMTCQLVRNAFLGQSNGNTRANETLFENERTEYPDETI